MEETEMIAFIEFGDKNSFSVDTAEGKRRLDGHLQTGKNRKFTST